MIIIIIVMIIIIVVIIVVPQPSPFGLTDVTLIEAVVWNPDESWTQSGPPSSERTMSNRCCVGFTDIMATPVSPGTRPHNVVQHRGENGRLVQMNFWFSGN